jgi:N-acetylmuramoyl-L-alanine amidase
MANNLSGLAKLKSYLAGWLTALTLALTLAACGESTTVTPVVKVNSVAPTSVSNATPVATTAPTKTTSAIPNVPAATNPVASSPVAAVTPTAVPPIPTVAQPTATPTQEALNQVNDPQDDPSRGTNQPLPDPNSLPRLNGVPKIPLLNTSLASVQPEPVIKANYGENGAPRVGVQIGHYEIDKLPDEQKSLRTSTGGAGGGVREVEVNQEIAKRVAALLTAKGITVDLLPATVPPAYTADAFVAIHADAASGGGPSGYKLARSRFSAIPQTDDALVNSIYHTYGKATGLPTSDSITRNMTGYYAFNSRRRLYAVSKITPAAIIEMGYLTNTSDRTYLLGHKDVVAQGIADGIIRFLQNRPALDQREKPQQRTPAIEALNENTPVYAENGGPVIAYVSKGQRFEFYEDKGTYYSVTIPVLRKPGYLRKTDAGPSVVPR